MIIINKKIIMIKVMIKNETTNENNPDTNQKLEEIENKDINQIESSINEKKEDNKDLDIKEINNELIGNKDKDENLITLDEKIKTNEINNNIEDKKGEKDIEGNQTIKTDEKIEVIDNKKITEKNNNENLIIEKIDENTINKEGDKNFNLNKEINKEKENMVEKMDWCKEYLNNTYMNFVDDVSDGLILYYTNNSK